MKLSGAGAFAALLLLMLLMYWPVFGMPPFESDNLYILSWADGTNAADLVRADPGVYPEWRPLAYLAVWLQYRWAGLDRMWTYYVLNALLWAACGWVVQRIVWTLSGSAAAGLASAAVILTSPELIDSVVLIVDRQVSLACLFGLLAWLLVARLGDRQPAPFEAASVSILLLASALSKEYGLAFAGAVVVSSLRARRSRLALGAVAAVGTYAALRLGVAGGALATYCEDHGYFFVQREVCFGTLDAMAASQAAYNIGATALGSVLPGLFTSFGAISIAPRWLLMSMAFLALAVLGWTRGPRTVRMGLFVIGFNALLSVLLYRSRNHGPALCAIGIAAGCGLRMAAVWLRQITPSRALRTSVALLLLTVLSMRVVVVRELVANRIAVSSRPDACAPGVPAIDRAFMERVWHMYNMPLPECREP